MVSFVSVWFVILKSVLFWFRLNSVSKQRTLDFDLGSVDGGNCV